MPGSRRTCFLVTICLVGLVVASHAQQFYATSETTGQLELVDLPSQTITTLYTAAGRPDAIVVNSQNQLIYDLSPQGILALYDPATNTNTVLLSNLKSPRDLLFDVPTTCNPNANANTMLVSEYSTGQIIRYDFTAGTFTNLGKQLGSKTTGFSVDGLAYDSQGNLFAVANHNTVVQLDPCTGDVLKTLVLEPHYKIDGGDGMVFDPYSGQLWISHCGSDNANGLIEVPTDLSTFSLFQSGQIPVPDGIVSDGKGNLYIGAGLQRLMAYNIPSDTLAQPSSKSMIVPGIDSLALITAASTPTFAVGSALPSVTVAAGGSVNVNLTVTPVGGAFNGTVSFAVSGQPSGSTVTFDPPTVSPGSLAVPIAMTIQLAAQTAARPRNHQSDFAFTSMFLAAGLCVIGSRYRRFAKSLPIVFAVAALAGVTLTIASCGGGAAMSPPTVPQSKTYVITITASSPSSPDASTTLKLIVQ